MNPLLNKLIIIGLIVCCSCNGSRKYFKAAEKLEKQGLINEAAQYYLESLQRKTSRVEARVKLKSVGQKYISNLASDFFRNYNTQQLEASLQSFERLKDFYSKSALLDVVFDYPKTYDDDYLIAVETFCEKNHAVAANLVYKKKYNEAIPFIVKVKKYNSSYKNIQQLDIISICEPLYQSAIFQLENKNYAGALSLLNKIKDKSDSYKDLKDLLELSIAQQTKSFMIFQPKANSDVSEKSIEEYLYSNFNQIALQKFNGVQIINNTPFQNATGSLDFNNNTNVDLIQAIRKATAADYFYTFDVTNKRENNSGLSKKSFTGFQEIKVRKNDTTIITEYKPFDYNLVKAQRAFSYDFNYKLINSNTNQIIASLSQNIKAQDGVEYQEFQKAISGNNNSFYPYNPQQTAAAAQYNPRSWRGLFNARTNLKSFDDLKNEAFNQTLTIFTGMSSKIK